ncbi:MAG: Hsp33 family molecular chaperone HslO [Terricaulis sp.]|nr:Hsp33 family molecular chaperone HslO [Terricaulis sp.]
MRGSPKARLKKLRRENRMPPDALLGAGRLMMTLDLGGDTTPYQGMVPLDGDTLAACAERYFLSSEQTETRIALSVGEVIGEGAPLWRGAGVLLQRIAADETRGDPAEDWSRATILFSTISDEEMLDPALPADRLLYRLFHEERAHGRACGASRSMHLQRRAPDQHHAAIPKGRSAGTCRA